MKATAVAQLDGSYAATAGDITLDAEFAALLPPASPEDKKLIEHALFVEGCRRPLVVWPVQGRRILVIGYEEFPILRLYGLPFRVVEKTFPNREAAFLFAIKDHLAHHHLSELEVRYLRGLRYHAEKEPHGGDRTGQEAQMPQAEKLAAANGSVAARGGRKTADALADLFQVTARTIRRDGELARAVERFVALFSPKLGPEIKWRLLSRQSRLTRESVLALARLTEKRQKDLGMQLLLDGKLPRNWRTNGQSQTMTVPRDAEAMAATLLRRLGREWLEDFRELVLLDVLTKPVKSEW